MAERIHYDPVTKQTWIPSSGKEPPYWANETLEAKEFWHRKKLLDDLLGNKPPPRIIMDAGYVFCPYIPILKTPTVVDPTTYEKNKGILTRYGKKLLEEGAKYYGKISF